MNARALSAFFTKKGSLLKSGILGSIVMPCKCFLVAGVDIQMILIKFTNLFPCNQERCIVPAMFKNLPLLVYKALYFKFFVDSSRL